MGMAPIYRSIGNLNYDLARWGYAGPDRTITYETPCEGLQGERRCMVPAESIDMITAAAGDTANSKRLSTRIRVKGAELFWIARIWQPVSAVGPQS